MPMLTQTPQFIVIGAVKAATTWISQQLRDHPLLWLPRAEPHYFSTEYHRGEEWYKALFAEAPADRIIGEKSADYLAHPLAAERIAKVLPDAKLIVQLRDPVERAYSDYCMLFRRGMAGHDPGRYLDPARAGETRFLTGGRYAHHLRRWQRHIPAERIKILLFEDVRDRPAETIAEVCAHIGVAPHVAQATMARRSNDGSAPMLPLSLRRLLAPARPLLDPLRTSPLFARARGAFARPVRYPPLTPQLRAMLSRYYRDDVAALGAMLARDLRDWSSSTGSAAGCPAAAEPELAYKGDGR